MSHKPVHRQTVELLLCAISSYSTEDGLLASFFFGKPGARHWERNLGADIYYRRKELISAALYVRRNGPIYLRYLSIDAIWSMLQTFVSENFWYLADDVFLKRVEGNFDKAVSEKSKEKFADALAVSSIFMPCDETILFPLATVNVDADFDSNPFFLIAAKSLDQKRLSEPSDSNWLVPGQFPPLSDFKGKKWHPSAWLGIRSPAVEASEKMRAAILGAVALTPPHRYRHLFSMRVVNGGRSTIGANGITSSFGQPHTPPLMHDITIGATDHPWLSLLSDKLVASERAVRRQIHALEYFYRSWPFEPSERFPVLCMTIDAAFGEATHATQSVIDGIRATLGDHVSGSRLRQLMELRASVIHGGAPDVYDSRKYARYFEDFSADPITDMEVVVAEALRVSIFGGALIEHPDPNADIIAEAQAKGRLPKNYKRPPTILDADDAPGAP